MKWTQKAGYYTEIYKFDIKENVEYKAKTKSKRKNNKSIFFRRKR